MSFETELVCFFLLLFTSPLPQERAGRQTSGNFGRKKIMRLKVLSCLSFVIETSRSLEIIMDTKSPYFLKFDNNYLCFAQTSSVCLCGETPPVHFWQQLCILAEAAVTSSR